MYLPAIPAKPTADEVVVERGGLPRGDDALILVVDDEEASRRVSQRTLERFGYRVILAENGAEALTVCAERQEEIAAVLTDMAMPVMGEPS